MNYVLVLALEGTQVVSLRDVNCRELIVNTLIHREYTSPFPAKLVIDTEGIRTEDASRPRFIGQLTPDRFNPLPKNPIIADLFTNIGLSDTLGSGTRNLFKYSWAYGVHSRCCGERRRRGLRRHNYRHQVAMPCAFLARMPRTAQGS